MTVLWFLPNHGGQDIDGDEPRQIQFFAANTTTWFDLGPEPIWYNDSIGQIFKSYNSKEIRKDASAQYWAIEGGSGIEPQLKHAEDINADATRGLVLFASEWIVMDYFDPFEYGGGM